MDSTPRWSVERRVPLALLATLCFHLMMLISWGTYLEARVSALEARTLPLMPMNENVARLEERLDSIRHDVGYIRGQVDKLMERK